MFEVLFLANAALSSARSSGSWSFPQWHASTPLTPAVC